MDVQLDSAAPPRRSSVSDEPVPALEANPWEPHQHVWVELYRYLPFLQAGHDTAEPPRMELTPEQAAAGATEAPPKERYEGDEFDVERDGATHYTTTDPGPEIAFRCEACAHVLAVAVPKRAAEKLLARIRVGEVKLDELSTLSHVELFGGPVEPSEEPQLAEPDREPDWLPEQRELERKLSGFGDLPALEEES